MPLEENSFLTFSWTIISDIWHLCFTSEVIEELGLLSKGHLGVYAPGSFYPFILLIIAIAYYVNITVEPLS